MEKPELDWSVSADRVAHLRRLVEDARAALALVPNDEQRDTDVGVDNAEVVADRLLTQTELAGDALVVSAPPAQPQQLSLAVGQVQGLRLAGHVAKRMRQYSHHLRAEPRPPASHEANHPDHRPWLVVLENVARGPARSSAAGSSRSAR